MHTCTSHLLGTLGLAIDGAELVQEIRVPGKIFPGGRHSRQNMACIIVNETRTSWQRKQNCCNTEIFHCRRTLLWLPSRAASVLCRCFGCCTTEGCTASTTAVCTHLPLRHLGKPSDVLGTAKRSQQHRNRRDGHSSPTKDDSECSVLVRHFTHNTLPLHESDCQGVVQLRIDLPFLL